MKLGRIVGTVVATRKDERLDVLRLLMVRDLALQASGAFAEKDAFVVAVDSVGAGVGEYVLYASGSQDTAIQLYTQVLQRDEHNLDALREYAKAYIDRRRPNDALRILLRVLVHVPNDADTRKLISEIIQSKGGLNVLFSMHERALIRPPRSSSL
jgi:microcompartment protein CcmK/EutM